MAMKMILRAVELGILPESTRTDAEEALSAYASNFSLNDNDIPAYNSEAFEIGARYVDDNLWIAEYFMERHKQTGDDTYIDQADTLVQLFIRSWNDTGGDGAYWQAQLGFPFESKDRAVVANAPAIPILIELSQLDPEKSDYADLAIDVYAWLQELRDPETGLYFDKFRGDGSIDTTFYPYVQAKIIDAMLALHTVDPDNYPLDDAIELFEKSVKHFTTNGRLGHDAAFDFMLVESGIQLAVILDDPRFTELVRQFSELTYQTDAARLDRLTILHNVGGFGNVALAYTVTREELEEWSTMYSWLPASQG